MNKLTSVTNYCIYKARKNREKKMKKAYYERVGGTFPFTHEIFTHSSANVRVENHDCDQ